MWQGQGQSTSTPPSPPRSFLATLPAGGVRKCFTALPNGGPQLLPRTSAPTSAMSSDNPTPDSLPSFLDQARNLAQSLGDFVRDGCRLVTQEQYLERLTICDGCEHRRGRRCLVCGCRLYLKARGRAFRCPLGKWPQA